MAECSWSSWSGPEPWTYVPMTSVLRKSVQQERSNETDRGGEGEDPEFETFYTPYYYT